MTEKTLTIEALLLAMDNLPRREEEERAYIGASSAGNPCDAFLAFSLRGFPGSGVDVRKERIFRLGHLIETEIVRHLAVACRNAGLGTVLATDSLTGRQFAMSEAGGHVAAHMDGQIVLPDESVIGLEIKTMNDKSFSSFQRDGVRVSHPVYYTQMQMMMALGGYRRFLIVAYNKNDSHIFAELVDWDPVEWDFHHVRIERVLNGVPVERIASAPDDWRCRGCFKLDACWNNAPAPKACRTCIKALPDISANAAKKWTCTLDNGTKEASHVCQHWERWAPEPRR